MLESQITFIRELNGMITLYLTKNLPEWLPKGLHQFAFPPAMEERSSFSTSSSTLVFVCLFYYSHSTGCEVGSHAVSVCVSMMTKDVELAF